MLYFYFAEIKQRALRSRSTSFDANNNHPSEIDPLTRGFNGAGESEKIGETGKKSSSKDAEMLGGWKKAVRSKEEVTSRIITKTLH